MKTGWGMKIEITMSPRSLPLETVSVMPVAPMIFSGGISGGSTASMIKNEYTGLPA